MSNFDLPLSTLLSAEARVQLEQLHREAEALAKLCPFKPATLVNKEEALGYRQWFDTHCHPPLVAKQKARYRVDIKAETIAGIETEVFTPAEGVSPHNEPRVLINLHGGGFILGSRWGRQIESIPISATGRIKVVSPKYRLAPEYQYPAATEDVVKVYQGLLEDYRPESIGLYGCSAGALLTAQTIAYLAKAGLPRPGAIGLFAAAGGYFGEGDSGHWYAARAGSPVSVLADPHGSLYFKEIDPNDSLAFPVRSRELLSQFPPSLFATATRDFALSSVVHMHSLLVEFGVRADLHVWEGLDHGFHGDPELPQSRQLYAICARFFDTHLGRN